MPPEPFQFPAQRGLERRTGMGHAATDHDALDVVGHDERVDRPGESSPDVVDEFAGGRIAGRRGLIDLLRRLLVGATGDGGPRCEGLEATELTALARAAELDDRVTDLTGVPRAPRWSLPSRTTPAAMPVPTAR